MKAYIVTVMHDCKNIAKVFLDYQGAVNYSNHLDNIIYNLGRFSLYKNAAQHIPNQDVLEKHFDNETISLINNLDLGRYSDVIIEHSNIG
jgi:hypothetical protein